ncbi:MAG: glutamate mutase L [Eubacteriales bacterium]|nr:glutamate mutase L [Eubacteriales bacterium]MCI6979829.1 GlmL-related ornithine degradation protein [Clostridiales bacterium]HZK45890.1 GlmL-related ornithine degradation protein [Clostridia bacterium]
MNIDVLVAEIGSTTTLVNAFAGINTDEPRFIGQGQAPTSVLEGDVRIGLEGAVEDLKNRLGLDKIEYGEMLATSSAAGGLRMCVHGLVYDMTVKAAQAAALGAGAIVTMATAGKMSEYDIEDLVASRPNLILLAGGTDYGERETALYNAARIAETRLKAPVIYAGNVQNQRAVMDIFKKAGVSCTVTENVYPKLDKLNIEPARKIIHKVFEEHIIKAPGMEHIRDMVTGSIMPTPGAVMEAVQLIYNEIGDVVAVDIGGATTDVHSVTGGSEEIGILMTSPEPFAKRTVEGDLGLYVNAKNLIERIGESALQNELGIDMEAVMANYLPIPKTEGQFKLTERLCREAGLVALERHAGALRYIYTPSGRKTVAEGKDLTAVKTIIGTGGALTRLPHREQLLRALADCNATGMMLYPKPSKIRLLFDDDYIMASLGVMSKHYPEAALKLMKRSLNI